MSYTKEELLTMEKRPKRRRYYTISRLVQNGGRLVISTGYDSISEEDSLESF